MAQQNWTISGTIKVRESALTEHSVDRPLPNAEVEVMASEMFDVYASWGTVRTDSNGRFELHNEKDKSKRKFRIKVRLADSELEVNTGALAGIGDFLSPAMVVFEHADEVDGPNVSIGTRTFIEGASGELGSRDNVRQAISWYVVKTVINTLQARDSYFDFAGKIRVVYPANVVSGQCYANGLTRAAYIHQNSSSDQWTVPVVLHEVMHLWNYDHNYGTANWLAAVLCPPDLDTHGQEEQRPIAFHEGFAEYAAYGLLHEIWGAETDSRFTRPSPWSRYAIAHQINAHTAAEVERNDYGVYRGLALLTSRALYKREFGNDDVQPSGPDYPEPAKIDKPANLDCPTGVALTVYDVLKVFQANSSAGWPTEWQVGDNEYGLYRFFHRAADVLSGLDEATKDLMLELLDPDSTTEPQDRCVLGSHTIKDAVVSSHQVDLSDLAVGQAHVSLRRA